MVLSVFESLEPQFINFLGVLCGPGDRITSPVCLLVFLY